MYTVAAVALVALLALAAAFLKTWRDLRHQKRAMARAITEGGPLPQVTPKPRPPAPPRPGTGFTCKLVCSVCGETATLATGGITSAEVIAMGRAAGWHVGITANHDRCPAHREGQTDGI